MNDKFQGIINLVCTIKIKGEELSSLKIAVKIVQFRLMSRNLVKGRLVSDCGLPKIDIRHVLRLLAEANG